MILLLFLFTIANVLFHFKLREAYQQIHEKVKIDSIKDLQNNVIRVLST